MVFQFQEGRSLKDLTTFGIGGPAKYFIEASSIDQLSEIVAYCAEKKLRYLVLGKGSNILFPDDGYDGVVILNKIHFCEEEKGIFYVGAGYSFSLLGSQTARKGWAGLEFASGIPGSVGGAVYMNAGANGGETFQYLTEVTYINEKGKIEVLPKGKLQWGYRTSSFQSRKGAIVAAKFHLIPSTEARARQLKIIDYRTKTQPYGDMSAGCVFRNAAHMSAGALIEECDLKGFSIGGAEVSLLHANFIVNRNNATAGDVLALAAHVKKVVFEKTGHDLEMEIRIINDLC
ncbi:MAG TPA: UDP-N-acetylmuramate dehydrogenase [Rhabdochlamydiaceae bacterium]|nr:UDP-N-acetylmuramate dehydrogenase [Rhabdochlamydiaceae bacterium]